MARTTPAQEMAQDAPAAAPDCAANAASAILQRHRGPRQRFDSADYVLGDSFQRALALKALGSTAAGSVDSTKGRRASGHHDVELEPEPEHCRLREEQCHAFPRQSLRRLRLQRFDSADWAMELDSERGRADRVDGSNSSEAAMAAPAKRGSVAHLLLERHAYRTYTEMAALSASGTSSRCAEQA